MKERPELSDEHFAMEPRVASAMECTGLIPAGMVSNDEADSYEELYHFLPPEDGGFSSVGLPNGLDPVPHDSWHDTPSPVYHATSPSAYHETPADQNHDGVPANCTDSPPANCHDVPPLQEKM